MKKFTSEYAAQAVTELNRLVDTAVATMYPVMDIKSKLSVAIQQAISDSMQTLMALPAEERWDVKIPDEEFRAKVVNLPKDLQSLQYKRRAIAIRRILINSIINAKSSINTVALSAIKSVIMSALDSGREYVTLSQVVHNTKLKADITMIHGTTESPSPWKTDEIRLQLINELCELNYLDMKIIDKTHMIAIPDKLSSIVSPSDWKEMQKLAAYINKKTIRLDPIEVDHKNMITRSSWFYQTPMLSDSQIKLVEIMQSTKFEFVENAEDLIAEAYREHLQEAKLPKWAVGRVEFFKEQIRLSKENNGHYVAVRFDSALRAYYMAEIGHLQSSPSLRKLVRVQGLDMVKYDMSNNVVQMYAIAMGLKSLAKYVKLVDPLECVEDVRLQLASRLNSELNVNVFNKDNTKPLFMVWAYNAGKARICEGVYTQEEEFFGMTSKVVKVKGLVELTGIQDQDKLWEVWNNILIELVPSIVALKKIFNRLTQKNPFTLATWTLPDGSIAQYASAVTNQQTLSFASSEYRLRQHTHHRKELEENAKVAGLLPRTIHSLDAYVMRQLVIRAYDLGIVIVPNHDSFTFSREYTDIVFALLREILIEILDSKVFEGILKQLNKVKASLAIKTPDGKFITTSMFGDALTADDLLKSFPMVLED